MRTQFIQCDTLDEAMDAAPWAAYYERVAGGYYVFASALDYNIWKNQK